MSFAVLMTLTVLQVVALVAVLAIYLILLTGHLRSISTSLAQITWGVRAVEVEVEAIEPSVTQVNGLLEELTGELLPAVDDKAARLAG
jgi:hypothetical protein